MNTKARNFPLLTSMILTTLFFGFIFFNISNKTFVANGDQAQLCYPSFERLGFLLRRGIFNGVDITTFNGASEFFSRSNLTSMYPIAMIFAIIGDAFSIQYFMYSLMFALHFFTTVYLTQLLATRFFHMSKHMAFLLACSCLMLYSYEIWYTGFFLTATLVLPLLYVSLSLINGKKRYIFLYSLPYVMAFTTGYITASVVLTGTVFLVTCAYILCYADKEEHVKMLLKLLSAIIIAGIVCLLYYYQVYQYVGNTVGTTGNSLSQVWELSLNPDDMWVIALASYIPSFVIEQYSAITVGLVWVIAMITLFVYREREDKKKLIFHNLILIINAILFMIILGNSMPVITWFYALVPVLGQMHLPIRYMMVTLPLLLLVLCCKITVLPSSGGQKVYKYLAGALAMIAIIFSIISKMYKPTNLDSGLFILEILMAAVVVFEVYKSGWGSNRTILLWCASLVLLAGTVFYKYTTPAMNVWEKTSNNIYYNSNDISVLNDYLSRDSYKLLRRYVCLDEDKAISPYVSQNFPWSNETKHDISNYYGYELHLAWPKDYAALMGGWFTGVNWQYVKDTRCDFVILAPSYIEKNKQFLDTIVNWEESNYHLSNGMQICTLKKYIPSFYVGNGDVLDERTDALDNGYFYSPQLLRRDMTKFETDRSRYFYAEINAGEEEQIIAFLPYANKYYKYFVDGQEILPTVLDSQAFLRVPPGRHEIKVIYKNMVSTLGGAIIIGYYFLIVIYASGLCVFSIKDRRRKNKK